MDSPEPVPPRVHGHWQVGIISFSVAEMPQMLASLEMLEVRKIHLVTLMMGTNEVSRSESRNMMRLPEKVSCIIEEMGIYLDPTMLTICTVPYNIMQAENAMNMKERVRHINDIIQEAQKKSRLAFKWPIL